MGIKVTGMDEVEAWSGGVILGPGRHTVVIDSAEEGKSSGGYDQVELQFRAEDGSGEIRDWLVFANENSLGKARMLLDAVGIEAQGGDWDFPTIQLPGRRLQIVVGREPSYKDPTKDRSVVKAYEPLGETNGTGTGDDGIPF